MWNRQELKANAKTDLKRNYVKAVIASLVLLICTGALTISSWSSTITDDNGNEVALEELSTLDPEMFIGLVLMILAMLTIGSLIGFVVRMLLANPLEIGAKQMFLNCKDGRAGFGDLLSPFVNGYGNAVKTLFLRWLFIKLWGLLFVIPGIVKAYQYKMVPYLLAEDPRMSSGEAFARSKQMMDGNKWSAFVLDLSFIGWHLLGACTLGIVEIFYSAPYYELTSAELYHALKG